MALNGWITFAIDLEGYGFSSGFRITQLSVDKMHHQVSTLMGLATTLPDLPAVLVGHSLGGLVINNYLLNNPDIAKKLAGVIYSAPSMGMAPNHRKSDFQRMIFGHVAQNADELMFVAGMQTHKICTQKQHCRRQLTQRKAVPFITASMGLSIFKHHD